LRESIEKEKSDIERLREKLKAKKDEFAKKINQLILQPKIILK
jgi:DNA-binding transcriptional regulator YiaG